MPAPLRLPLAPRWSALVLPQPGGLAVVTLERDGVAVEVVDDPHDVLGWLGWLEGLVERAGVNARARRRPRSG